MRSRPILAVAALALSLAVPLVTTATSQASATASSRSERAADPLAVKVWADPGPYVYRSFRVWFEMKDSAVDPNRYQMRVRRDGPRSGPTDWQLRRYALSQGAVNLRQVARACIQVRAKKGGVAGPWSRTICGIGVIPGYEFSVRTVAPDDRVWFPLTKGQSAFGGTVLYTDNTSAKAHIRDVQIKRIKLWALRCGNCGKTSISFKGKTLARVDLSARKRHSAVVWQREFNRPRHGTITITVASADGRLVQLDAAAIERNNRLTR